MKKALKKLMAAMLAVAMVMAMAVPAMAAGATDADLSSHTFEAYQIFNGDVDDTGKLSNVTWGANIDSNTILNDLQSDSTLGTYFADATTVADVISVISSWSETDAKTTAFARFISAKKTGTASATSTGTSITFTKVGYYLIVDTTNVSGADSANNLSLLKVSKAETITIRSKVVKPTVDKYVYDNNDGVATGDNNGWGKTADHAIGESFQFKLTANLPASAEKAYDSYEAYKVVFHDTMSKGITFERIASVTVGSTPLTAADYTVSDVTTNEDGTQDWTLTIANVKEHVASLDNGTNIEVIYNAHLNQDATVNTASGSTDNENKVYLEFSNNPNVSGDTGKTPEEDVYVFTYQLNNTKHKDTEDGDPLEGAGFRLYTDADCANELKLQQNTDGTYSRYFGEDAGVEMFSDAEGKFNVKGLDAGTYYLKETSTPTGFNTCPVTTIVISATHTKNNVDLTGSNTTNNIVNKSGATLPSTGGIGTTIFYVVGGILMVGAAVLLITKKRMENKN